MFARNMEGVLTGQQAERHRRAESATDYLSLKFTPSRSRFVKCPPEGPFRWAHLRTARGLPEMSLPVLRLNSCVHGTWRPSQCTALMSAVEALYMSTITYFTVHSQHSQPELALP